MRHVHKLVGTGCFFLCLGGWGYNTQVIGETPINANAAMNAAVAETVAATTTAPALPEQAAPLASAATAPAPAAAPEPAVPETAVPETAPSEGVAPAVPNLAANATPNLNSTLVDVDVDGSVKSFDAPDLDISTALYLLSLQTKRNIITSKEVKGTVNAHLHNVSFTEALDALLTPNGFGYIEKGNFIYVYSAKELEDIKKRDRKTVNQVYRLKYMTALDASVLIKPILSANGQIALTPTATVGIPDGVGETGGAAYATDDTLVINDYPDNLKEIAKTLKELDVRPKQVLVESTILRATLSENNALGIDFISLSGIDLSGLTGAVSGAANAITTPAPYAGATVPSNNNTQTNVGTDFASSVPKGGLSVGFLSNNVSIFLRALEQTTDTTVVANPKILALNKHRGEVFIGQQFGYKTTTTSSTTTSETVQFLDTGTKLIFRPFITDDGYVRMEVHPEDSAGGLNSSNLPEKQSTEVTSNIMIRDGRTVVIGGMFREQTSAGRSQVPIIGNLPLIGIPFRQTQDTTTRSETIVLLTPHIINDDTALYEESAKREEDVNRMMLGNRAGLQPWGRDRLAQTWYAKAEEAQAKGEHDKALMFTDWALNTNPRFIEAIRMKETLTGKKVQGQSESSIRSFVRNVMHDDRATIPDTGTSGHYPPAATQP